MGSQKRNFDSVEVVEGELGASTNEVVTKKKSKKKMTKEKGKGEEFIDGDNGPSEVPTSVKPMERKKKRKTLDKERHRNAAENKKSEPKVMDVESKSHVLQESTLASSSSGGLPEFHIGVFKDLASADASVREAAAEALVTELQEVQKAYDRLETKDLVEGGLKLEAQKDDGLNECAPSLRYAVRRLIRGVSSSREFARQGFALGLTILIGVIPQIKVDSLLKLIVDLLEVNSSTKGQEARDCFLGCLFAYGALARSGRLVEEWISDRNTPYIKEFTSLLVSLAIKKRYLQEPSVSVILDLIEKLPPESLENEVLKAPGVHKWFEGAAEVGNPDALLLALKIHEKAPVDSAVFSKLLPNPFSPNKLFAVDHLSTLANCLKESTFCQPRVHGVWPVLVNILLPDIILQAEDAVSASNSLKKHKKSRKCSSSEEEIAKNLQSFIEVIVEGSLLLSSHDRKHLAFDVLLLLLPKLPASFVPIILSYKLIQCLMDILSTKNSWLFKVAQHFLKELSDWVNNDDVRRVAVIVALQKHSYGKFDAITRTKTVKDLMADFQTESGCMLFIQNLLNMFVDESHVSDEPSDQSQTTDDNSEIGSVEDKDSIGTNGNSDFLKSWIIESLPSILKYVKVDLEAKFRVQKEVLKFLAVQGLFTASLGSEVTSFELQEKFRWPKAATSTALCRMCIEQLQLLLANAQKGEGSQALPNGLEPNDLGSYFMRFLSTLRNIPSISLFRPLEDEEESILKKLQAMETSLSREERNCGLSGDANRLHALRYLLIQLLLQVLHRPREFLEAATDVIVCCRKAFPAPDLLDSSGEDDVDADEPSPTDVLVETFLSILVLPELPAPMRSAIEQVFKYFCDDITDDGLLHMLRVVKRNLDRHQVSESENDDDVDEDEEDFLEIKDDEVIDEETGETVESDDQTDDSEDIGGIEEVGKESSEDVGGIEEVGKQSSEVPDDSDEEWDDETMFRIDNMLAQRCKEKMKQAGSETAQYQLEQFKLRVLSLLEIYLHENPDKPQVLVVYSNLLWALTNPQASESSEQLRQRIWGIIRKIIFNKKDHPNGEGVQLSTFESLLQKNLKLASKPIKRNIPANLSKKQSSSWNQRKVIASLAQNSTFWILKVIDAQNFPQSKLQRLFGIFQGVIVEYFNSKRSQIKSEFLKEIFQRRPWIGHHLFGFILEKCANSKSEFRRVEALDLLIKILGTMGSSKGTDQDLLKKNVESHLSNLCHLIETLVENKSEKQSRRRQAEVRKFCGKIFRIISSLNLMESFLNILNPNAHALCQSQLGDKFVKLKKT